MDNDILKLFEGLTAEQVRELRQRIIPTLQELRREIAKDRELFDYEGETDPAKIREAVKQGKQAKNKQSLEEE